MNADQVLFLLGDAFKTAFFLIGPLLGAALFAGLLIGILQTATQINEAGLTYLAKLIALAAVLLALGPMLSAEALRYMRTSFQSIATVVK
jgi:flagellar biosynthetic protein FliQ